MSGPACEAGRQKGTELNALATGNWQLATGNWQLATGNWQDVISRFLTKEKGYHFTGHQQRIHYNQQVQRSEDSL
ncbi:hypothetical protein H2241_10460 [Pantoea ananatis]|uniref:hypothetical protein n=1 Tax=Pantoea ananas TaxID=553 RepID=UPI00158DE6E5|nr:hypothetical protein [Pantoea ananatis]MBA4821396.1 hypothetical protein [Pantoea ananatis]QKV85814.1 hypothetical protein FOB88_01085 [Pantoea ananatis]